MTVMDGPPPSPLTGQGAALCLTPLPQLCLSVCLSLHLFIFRHRPSPTSLKSSALGAWEGRKEVNIYAD